MANTTNMPGNSICHPDCITEVKVGNTTLVVKGYLNTNATETAVDKMARILQAEVYSHSTEVA